MKKFLIDNKDNLLIFVACAVCICMGFFIGVDNALDTARALRFGTN